MEERIIQQTKKWVSRVVIGNGFCPFAARVYHDQSIHYQITMNTEPAKCLEILLNECFYLLECPEIATSLIVYPCTFGLFDDYLDFVELAEQLLAMQNLSNTFQLASFHPNYQFADSEANDPAHFTNRSPYPMLHILREEIVTKAIQQHPNSEQIPIRNIQFARKQGWAAMQKQWQSCFKFVKNTKEQLNKKIKRE